MMAYDINNVRVFVDISKKALRIAQKFWPGQLTLIFPTKEVGKILSGGKKDLGVRIPNNRFMLKLLKEINTPVFTTSVNVSNEKSAKNVDEALKFGSKVTGLTGNNEKSTEEIKKITEEIISISGELKLITGQMKTKTGRKKQKQDR